MVKIVVDGLEIETERPTSDPISQWINVDDQLPPDKHEVMYFAINEMGNKEIMTGHRENGAWTHCCLWYSTQTLNPLVKVTHWMELPNYPK